MPIKTKVEAIAHLNQLYKIRFSGVILEAAKDWLDKEIADLKKDILMREVPHV